MLQMVQSIQSRQPAKPDTEPLTTLLHSSTSFRAQPSTVPTSSYLLLPEGLAQLHRYQTSHIHLRPHLRLSYFNKVGFDIQISKSGVMI
jgi:hypothetical protein